MSSEYYRGLADAHAAQFSQNIADASAAIARNAREKMARDEVIESWEEGVEILERLALTWKKRAIIAEASEAAGKLMLKDLRQNGLVSASKELVNERFLLHYNEEIAKRSEEVGVQF